MQALENVLKREFKLPSDVEACHALILELLEHLESKDSDILCLKQRLQNLLRDKFGRSSEKLSPGQLLVFGQELEELLGREVGQEKTDTPEPSEPAKPRKKHGGGGRKPIAPSVKRERRDYFPPEEEMTCRDCQAKKTEIGTEILEQLDYVPASFKVIEHCTHKFACKPCQEGVVEGERPAQIHSGGKPTEGVIAQISTAKFADHLPLYRQEQIYAREGVHVARSSMGRWLEMSAQAAMPLYDRMHEILLESKVIQADESPITLLDKNRLPKKCKQAYAWAYYGDQQHPYAFYDLQPDRTAERPKEILRGYANFLLTDGYGGYEWFPLERSANCNVHLRRYIEKSLKYDKKRAGSVIAMYSELYKIEARIKDLSDEEILRVRQSESLPILVRMKELFLEWQLKTPPKTPLGIAINYGLPRWEKLCRFTEHAFLRMDTNLVENSIRPIAVGRNSWQHIGAESALETASVHMTLVNTCKRLNLNPYLYLRDIFIRLGRGEDCIDDLLPDRWQLKHPLESKSSPEPE